MDKLLFLGSSAFLSCYHLRKFYVLTINMAPNFVPDSVPIIRLTNCQLFFNCSAMKTNSLLSKNLISIEWEWDQNKFCQFPVKFFAYYPSGNQQNAKLWLNLTIYPFQPENQHHPIQHMNQLVLTSCHPNSC